MRQPVDRRSRWWIALLLVSVLHLGMARAAGALEPRTLHLEVEVAPGLPDPAALQLALEHELGVFVAIGRPIAAGDAVLYVRPGQTGSAEVQFRAAEGRTVGRTMRLPVEPARAAETLALLAANLVRNEAAELLDGLRPAPAPPAVATASNSVAGELERVPWAIDVLPGVGWPLPAGRPVVRELSLGVFCTYSAALEGIAAAPLCNLTSRWASGVQLSAVANVAFGPVQGMQVASSVNIAAGPLRGAQLGSALNFAGSLNLGVQGGIVNLVGGDMRGVQGGVVNLAGDVRGVQGGVVNLAGDVQGGQAGVVNLAGAMQGAQVGVVNLARRRVTGVQLGVVNLGEDADAGIGLLSIYWRGRTHVQAWTQASGLTFAGVKHGSRLVHNVFGIGAIGVAGSLRPAVVFGLGGHLRLGGRLHVDVDLLEHLVLSQDFDRLPPDLLQLRAVVGLRLFGSLGVFAGPTFDLAKVHADSGGRFDDPFPGQTPGGQLVYDRGDMRMRAWPGITLGLSGL